MSMATMASLFCSSILAAVTYWLPGPRILSTLGQLPVPHAMAATACAPPALSTWVTPAFLAQYSTSGVMLPSGRGGVAITMVWHPAILAGTESMRVLEGSTAVPPGTYTPTAPIGRVTLRHLTPGMVSTSRGRCCCWASWKALMLAYATSNASVMSLGSTGSGRSSILTQTLCRLTRSKREVNSLTASSPSWRTFSTMGATVLRIDEKSMRGLASTVLSWLASSLLRWYTFNVSSTLATAPADIFTLTGRDATRVPATDGDANR
mmetsp:Transcript_35542/g.78871  ORF Transcript_35542/g.78871 Transcript_35542/m.78871 type:complete len:264 (+) Transcript_35542:1353-2144(+)